MITQIFIIIIILWKKNTHLLFSALFTIQLVTDLNISIQITIERRKYQIPNANASCLFTQLFFLLLPPPLPLSLSLSLFGSSSILCMALCAPLSRMKFASAKCCVWVRFAYPIRYKQNSFNWKFSGQLVLWTTTKQYALNRLNIGFIITSKSTLNFIVLFPFVKKAKKNAKVYHKCLLTCVQLFNFN